MSPNTRALRQRLLDQASEPYRSAGKFAFHFARHKLGMDPVFCAMLERGLFPDQARILDLGCGQGLLAAWLLSARHRYDLGDWPEEWPIPPLGVKVRGVDLLARDLERARLALGDRASFEEGDMRQVDFGRADVVIILDALHFLDGPAQADILRRVRIALTPRGLLVVRVGDAGAGLRFHLSHWIDSRVAWCRGMGLPHLHCRPLSNWIQALKILGFHVESASMNGNLPFANYLLIARLDEASGPLI